MILNLVNFIATSLLNKVINKLLVKYLQYLLEILIYNKECSYQKIPNTIGPQLFWVLRNFGI